METGERRRQAFPAVGALLAAIADFSVTNSAIILSKLAMGIATRATSTSANLPGETIRSSTKERVTPNDPAEVMTLFVQTVGSDKFGSNGLGAFGPAALAGDLFVIFGPHFYRLQDGRFLSRESIP